MSNELVRMGSKFYWEGWDACEDGKKKKNPYPASPIGKSALQLESDNDPHWMWDYGYDMCVATKKTFGEY